MTRYAEDIETPVAFPEQDVHETLAEVLSSAGLRQLHAAETEKYAHVTYFFNGGEEREWEGEARVLVPSPRDVPSYDLKPEMSAAGVADEVVVAASAAATRSASSTSRTPTWSATPASSLPSSGPSKRPTRRSGGSCEATSALGGVCLVTADHGNAEIMLEPDGVSPHTAHTTSPVPLVLTAAGARLHEEGGLADLAPTVLDLLGIPIPEAMTGTPLVVSWDDGDG